MYPKISKTKDRLSIQLFLQKHVSFVSIVFLFLCLVYLTRCDYNVIFMTNPSKLYELKI